MLTFPAPKAASLNSTPSCCPDELAARPLSPQAQTVLTFAAIATFFIATLAVAAASVFFILRDDLINSALSRHAQMQHAYEDRINALRSKVDLVTSRQLLDQRKVEQRVEKLLSQQRELSRRAASVNRAHSRSRLTTGSTSVPSPKIVPSGSGTPLRKSFLDGESGLRLGSLGGLRGGSNLNSQRRASVATTTGGLSLAQTGATFDRLERTLQTAAAQQIASLEILRDGALKKARRLRSLLASKRIKVPGSPSSKSGIGGPLIEANGTLTDQGPFAQAEAALNVALKDLSRVQRIARRVPHGNPTPGSAISSQFGTRRDPFTGRRAIHAGLDYRAKTGTPIYATAGGKIIRAGRRGGYGKLVEISHGNGMSTRYAHMSRINVTKGSRVKRGQMIGRVGSTGRSTGPHLHYEVRRNGRPVNPIHYVRFGKKLRPLL
ncbi:MAG: M23 family metallopeptidase [Pseudomonadota bacterium]